MSKRKIAVRTLMVMVLLQLLFAQERVMILHDNDGSVMRKPVTEIDSVTFQETGTLTYNGYTYKTVKIGSQWWLAENLRTATYRDGITIPANAVWPPNGDEGNVATYGLLYSWYALSSSNGIAPIGWHVPSAGEWQQLADYLGGNSVAGGKLLANGTDNYGFRALTAGFRQSTGFLSFNLVAKFWTGTEASASYAYGCTMMDGSNQFDGLGNSFKNQGCSVRLVKDSD
ncbi:MAG: hypothetical protein JXQ65_14005 [Candidatus Marinimicrobia bacterium]|nr:hypothetical protein [Candidatus Neomarinimicrobiota bacterium]